MLILATLWEIQLNPLKEAKTEDWEMFVEVLVA